MRIVSFLYQVQYIDNGCPFCPQRFILRRIIPGYTVSGEVKNSLALGGISTRLDRYLDRSKYRSEISFHYLISDIRPTRVERVREIPAGEEPISDCCSKHVKFPCCKCIRWLTSVRETRV